MSRPWRSTRRARSRDTLRAHGWDDGPGGGRRGRHPSPRLPSDRTGPGRPRGPGPAVPVPSASRSSPGDDWAIARRQPLPPQRLRPALDSCRPRSPRLALEVGLAMPAEPPPVWAHRPRSRLARPSGAHGHPQRHARQLQRRRPLRRRSTRRWPTPTRCSRRARRIVDVGGESTRPGRDEPVPGGVELARVRAGGRGAGPARIPTLLLSVDTVKSEVARAALDAGAAVDQRRLRASGSIPELGRGRWPQASAGVVLMHSRGPILEIASYAHADLRRTSWAKCWPSCAARLRGRGRGRRRPGARS